MSPKILLLAAITFFAFVLFGCLAQAGELCQIERGAGEGWHYRTRVGGRPERCYYLGRAMKPRRELYWAEAPAIAPADEPAWQLIDRWRGEYQNPGAAPGWQHKE